MARSNTNSGGCWKQLTTLLVVVLALAVVGYALMGNRRVRNLFGVDVERLFETYVTDSLSDPTFTKTGILKAVEASGWSPATEPGVVQTKGRAARVQKFEREGLEVTVRVIAFETEEAAAKYADGMGDARRAVPFDRKVAILDPRGIANPGASGPFLSLVEELERFRRMVRTSKK